MNWGRVVLTQERGGSMCLRKRQSSEVNPSSAVPKFVLLAVNISGTSPSCKSRSLGPCAHLVQAERAQPGSHSTPWDENLGSAYNYDRHISISLLRQHKRDLPSLQDTFTHSTVRMASQQFYVVCVTTTTTPHLSDGKMETQTVLQGHALENGLEAPKCCC